MAKPDFAPGVTVEVTLVGPAGETVLCKRVEIGCGDGGEARGIYLQLLESAKVVKKHREG